MILHAVWSARRLHLWAEERPGREASPPADASPAAVAADGSRTHPFAAAAERIAAALPIVRGGEADPLPTVLQLLLPHRADGTPCPSARLLGLLGEDPPEEPLELRATAVPAVEVDPAAAVPLLLRLEQEIPPGLVGGHDLGIWFAIARFVAERLEAQRVVPTVEADAGGGCESRWRAWIGDADAHRRLERFAAAMPVAAICGLDGSGDAREAVSQAIDAFVDAIVRQTLLGENFPDSLEDWDAGADLHVRWLSMLLGHDARCELPDAARLELPRRVRAWLGRLEERASGSAWRLHLMLREPARDADARGGGWVAETGLVPADPAAHEDAGEDGRPVRISAAEILGGNATTPFGSAEDLEETLLRELARAGRIWPRLEAAIRAGTPEAVPLSTGESYTLLREYAPVLEEAGIAVETPRWWGQPTSRLGIRLHLAPDEEIAADAAGRRGIDRTVSYRWELVLGGDAVSIEHLRRIAAEGAPLLRFGDGWAEIRPEDLTAATRLLAGELEGRATLREAMQMASGLDPRTAALGLRPAGLETSGWLSELFARDPAEQIELLEPPASFRGELRPYQRSGLSWLQFLDRLGMGGCLADDMGLGKTIQVIALLQHERERALGGATPPTLVVSPMSVVGNWQRELARFAPELRVHRHHGLDRPVGDRFLAIASESDVVLTTYGLVGRDLDLLGRIRWRRVVLDEAQHIKNPPTKTAAAIRALECDHRVALTGTPVENRLGELWSILEFCCPGYLGASAEFRRRFALPIERHRDRHAAEQLRQLVRPFVLRRLKTDPKVIHDLPPLVQSRQHVTLSPEQTSLYEQSVAGMLRSLDRAEGIRRRGLVLAGLVRLKQICNHPAQFLGEELPESTSVAAFAGRSGKASRLLEMLEEMLAAGDRMLLFTQYRQMGHLLAAMLRRQFDLEPLFLHGGTPVARREQMVDRFQSNDPRSPVFILSLRAGGVGLNLTSATQVIHYDRWWNPAVENQATDRAFRIGQTRTVHVHKMVAAGTLEERIDQMIEQKIQLAEQVVGSGEAWLTELSTGQLQDLLQLRHAAFEDRVPQAEEIGA
jgi:hypothetical protein